MCIECQFFLWASNGKRGYSTQEEETKEVKEHKCKCVLNVSSFFGHAYDSYDSFM